jgi:hypothetical protein
MADGNGSSTSHIAGDRLDHLTATHVVVDRSAIRSLDADQAQMERAAVNRMRAGQATLDKSAIAIASFDQGTIRQSSAGVIVARSVACDEVRTVILAAPVVRGEVHTWLDLRSAVAIGFGMVLGKAVIAGVRGLVRRALA